MSNTDPLSYYGHTSTGVLATATRLSILKQQIQLEAAQKELATGRKADVGKDLGSLTKQTLLLRQEYERVGSMVDNNGIVASRIETSQMALSSMTSGADEVLGQVLSLRTDFTQSKVLERSANNALGSLTALLNTSLGGEYLFSGINTDVKPVDTPLSDPSSPGRQAIETAFVTRFGFGTTDPLVSTITPASMQNFIETDFEALFQDPAWGTLWSSASDQAIQSRISNHDLLETSVTANDQGIRDLVKGYAMLSGLGISAVSAPTYDKISELSSLTLGAATQGITQSQGYLGQIQAQIETSNTRMQTQKTLLNNSINAFENVDLYEVSTQVNLLLNQMQASYALTSKIQNLSLLDYL